MLKVYCKGCSHLGIIRKSSYVGSWKVPGCHHPLCFEGRIEEVDYPIKRKKVDNRKRINKTLNSNNDCCYFQQKVSFIGKLLGKRSVEKAKAKENVFSREPDTSEVTLLRQNDRKKEVIAKLKKKIVDKDEIILMQYKIIEKQNNIVFKRVEKASSREAKKTVFDKIDLD